MPGDSLRLYRLQRKGVALDLQRDLTQGQQPLRDAWLAFLTQQAMGQPTYVLYDPHDGEAFVQIRYRPHQAAADVVYVAPALAKNGRPSHAWSRLLDGACVDVAVRGIQRVFANLPESGAEVDIFQQSGFTLYTGEDIYCLEEPQAGQASSKPAGLRAQQPEDWPAIQKLCVAITPQRVRQAEGGIASTINNTRNCQRYVLPGENGQDLVAVMDLYAGGLAHWLRILVHPDARSTAAALIRWGMAELNDRATRPVYCNVRQYESGIRTHLESVGFRLYTSRALMVRHAIAWVRVPTPELVPGLKSSAEAVPPAYHINGEPEFQTGNSRLAAKREA